MPYDVALSFAAEDRSYVARVAEALRSRAVRVFYDFDAEAELTGKALREHLDRVFRKETRFFCVAFISAAYAESRWAMYELESALEKAFEDSADYIIPARFDMTEIPGIRQGRKYIDLRDRDPEEVADLICEKIQRVYFESSIGDQAGGLRWFPEPEAGIGGGVASLRVFQQLPVVSRVDPLETVISEILLNILRRARVSQEGVYWTCREDRRFDRVYATSSALYALLQLGARREAPLVDGAIRYLKQTLPASIDDRAATILLLVIDELPRADVADFLTTLARFQISDGDSPHRGSFLLAQGPVDPGGALPHWSPPRHRDGASFHACHIADALLHIPSHLPECREQAEPILSGIKGFIVRSYMEHDGWLVDESGSRTPLTLFSYALCPALRIPLPREWRTIGAECLRMAAQPSTGALTRFFGVMNAAYTVLSNPGGTFADTARSFVRSQLPALPAAEEIGSFQVPDVAALLRSVAYGMNLIDTRFLSSVRAAAAAVVDTWDGAASGERATARGERPPGG